MNCGDTISYQREFYVVIFTKTLLCFNFTSHLILIMDLIRSHHVSSCDAFNPTRVLKNINICMLNRTKSRISFFFCAVISFEGFRQI